LWTERLYQHKELDRYFFKTQWYTGEDTSVIEVSKGAAIGWFTENHIDCSFKETFGITFEVGVYKCISGEVFYDYYAPKTQLWDDVLEAYYTVCDDVYEYLKKDGISSECEWTEDNYLPVRRIVTESGDEYEVYVYTDEE